MDYYEFKCYYIRASTKPNNLKIAIKFIVKLIIVQFLKM